MVVSPFGWVIHSFKILYVFKHKLRPTKSLRLNPTRTLLALLTLLLLMLPLLLMLHALLVLLLLVERVLANTQTFI